MVYSIGTDIVSVARIEEMLKRHSEAFTRRVFTDREISYCLKQKRPAEHFAARFAAKEAVLKALGLGMGAGVPFKEIEVVRGSRGGPSLLLLGNARDAASSQRIVRIHLSVSHSRENAVAFVVAETDEKGESSSDEKS